MVIKTLNKENPFADYGNIITGKRFVGRENFISQIQNRVLGTNYGNIAIIGLPRIGKSSLVWNSLIPQKERLLSDQKIILVWLNIGTLKDDKTLYTKLLTKVIFELRKTNIEKNLLDELVNIKNEYKETRYIDDLETFFALIKQINYRIIYLLDEFDNAARILDLSDFQLLRELSISPETKICLVTISRRTIQEIELENGAISNFFGVFSELRLGMFSETDIDQYWKIVTSFEIEILDKYKNIVKYYVGNHPYLMDLFNFEVYNLLKENPSKLSEEIINETESRLKLTLFNNFDIMLKLLNIEGLYSKAVQIVLGPVYNVRVVDEQRLLKYEFIKLIHKSIKEKLLKRNAGINKDENTYLCFSDYFTEILNLKYSEIDYWPLWNKTEKYVRELIKEYLNGVFGKNWESKYLLEHQNSLRKINRFNKLVEVRESTKSKFGDLASDHLIDYTFPRDMYDLFMSTDWDWFGEALKDSKKEWAKRFNLLSEIRNPIAHNNTEFVAQDDLKLSKNICNIIIKRIDEWNEK